MHGCRRTIIASLINFVVVASLKTKKNAFRWDKGGRRINQHDLPGTTAHERTTRISILEELPLRSSQTLPKHSKSKSLFF